MLGTHSILDPTTAGDFCRRFSPEPIEQLQDKINEARQNVWVRQPKSFFDEAVVDMDGTISAECKVQSSKCKVISIPNLHFELVPHFSLFTLSGCGFGECGLENFS